MRRAAIAAALLAPALASAFSIESVATKGCHETVTRGALAAADWPTGANPQVPDGEMRGLADSLAFTVARNSDLWLISVLIGARDNDLFGASASDFTELSAIHNAAEGQDAHCLRAPSEDFGPGDATAVAACRAWIRAQVERALGPGSDIDLTSTDFVLVALRDRTTSLTLPRYPLQLGRALHALQDSFTHTYRTPDFRRITTVFNYADPATSNAYDATRDGIEHRSDFDTCAATEGRQAERVKAATQASTELMAALARDGTRAERLARVDAVLADWVTLEPGCTSDDDFCGSAEAEAKKCSVTGGAPWAALALGWLLRATARRPARRRSRCR
jgi:hypothetical protein